MNLIEGRRGNAPQESEKPTRRRIIMLSETERTVLTLQAQGKTNREIGNFLCKSESTVKQKYISPLLKRFGTTSSEETVKQAVLLGAVTDVPIISDTQLNNFTARERDILDQLLELTLTKDPRGQLSEKLHISLSSVKTHIENIYDKLDIKHIGRLTAMFAKTMPSPEQLDTIICVQSDQPAFSEPQIRWLETFAKDEDERATERRPDETEQIINVLRNGGTIDLTSTHLVDIITIPTYLAIKKPRQSHEVMIWPSITASQRERVSALSPAINPNDFQDDQLE